jgi:hypothetical protein
VIGETSRSFGFATKSSTKAELLYKQYTFYEQFTRMNLLRGAACSPSVVSIPHANRTWAESGRDSRSLIRKEYPALLVGLSPPYRSQRGGAIQHSVNLCSRIATQNPLGHAGIKGAVRTQ